MINVVLRILMLVSGVLGIVAISVAQTSKSKGFLDLTQEVKAISNKSINEIPTNTIALPIIMDNRKRVASMRWASEKANHKTELILGAEIQAYVMLTEVRLATGQRIVISDQHEHLYLYDNQEDIASGRIMTEELKGDIRIVAEGFSEQPSFRLDQVYVRPNVEAMDLGFGAGFECQVNINCDAGRPYADEKNGVMRIRMVAEEGVALCTGTLLNNTAQDGASLVLTAYHCLFPASSTLTPLFDMWRFDFGYESFSCANPEAEPRPIALQGAEVLAQWQETDMLLLRIQQEIPEDANAYYVGWDRRDDYNPVRTALIHQPAGDIKKITIDTDPVEAFDDVITWNNSTTTPPFSHFINDFDEGVYQPGSSGAGLFDDEGRVIGQLHGGPLSDELCTIGIGYSGRLAVSWDTGDGPEDRLKDWLDPEGTEAMQVDGVPANGTDQVVQVKGKIITSKGIAIPNVRISLVGDKEASFLTGTDGRFVFDNLSTKGTYEISFTRTSGAANGLSVLDLITIQNHILGKKLIESDFGKFAADVNNDGWCT